MARRREQVEIRWSSLLLGIGGLLIFILAFASCLVVQALTTDATHSATRTTARATSPTESSALSMVAPTATTNPDWHTYSFATYGFRVDIPTVLYPQHALLINGGAGESIDWVYQGAALGSPLREAAAETIVRVQYATIISDTNICPAGGTTVTIGSGIRAYQESNVPPDLNGPPASQPYVRVSLMTGGVAIRIELEGQGAPDAFFSRYGAIWQHMLASFATSPPLQPVTMHPCG